MDNYNADIKVLDEYFTSIYYDKSSPASFSGLAKVWGQVKKDPAKPKGITKKKLIKWLEKQETYQVHTRSPKNSPTEKIIVGYIDEMWDADILQLPTENPKANKNYRYMLGVIDLFSRHAWACLLKTKTAEETLNAFQSILSRGRKCDKLRTDAGGEFTGSRFQKMLKNKDIQHMTAYGEVKANYIERWNRTFQDKLYRWMYQNNTTVWVNVIDDILESYNNTTHGTTGFRPAQVTTENALALYEKVYIPILNKRASERLIFSFNIGQLVRLSLFIHKFKRGYTQNYTEEIFRVVATIPSHPPRYKIEDLEGETVEGSFYAEDLKEVNATQASNINWKINRVIWTRKIKGKKKSLVNWVGYPDKFNSIIPAADITKYSRRQ